MNLAPWLTLPGEIWPARAATGSSDARGSRVFRDFAVTG